MTQFFAEDGTVIPATIVAAGPIVVTQVKTADNDGYNAVQVGFGVRKEKNINKAQKGAWKELGNFRYVREFRLSTASDAQTGDTTTVEAFAPGDAIQVTGITKGKGFQGVVKRYNFGGSRRSHGNKHHERTGGSIGAGGVQRVFKGMKMPGRTGSDRHTTLGLKVLAVNLETNEMLIKGALPGRRGTLLEIVSAKS